MPALVLEPTPEVLARAVAAWRAGEPVAFPTETVYGLGADATKPDAVRKIFIAKGRPADHPLIVHVAPGDDLARWAAALPDTARRLIDAFWPGPLTLILPRSAAIPDAVTGGQPTVGLRCPAHPVAQSLLRMFGGAIAAPSANRFGRISPTQAAHVFEELGERIPLIVDGGAATIGIESTIVDLSGERPVLLRPGQITVESLSRVLQQPIQPVTGRDSTVRAAGMLDKHYAPQTPLRALPGAALQAAVEQAVRNRQHVAAIAWSAPIVTPPGLPLFKLPPSPDGVARGLYDALRQADRASVAVIFIEQPADGPDWAGIRDRVRKAVA
ncbi:MAG: L-threonylcarbamoyladenylate synthase [Burkholderiaceae bacterium]